MSFLQLVLSVDNTKAGINSILPIVSFWPISQQDINWESRKLKKLHISYCFMFLKYAGTLATTNFISSNLRRLEKYEICNFFHYVDYIDV